MVDIETQQHYIDEYYDEIDAKASKDFEKLLETRVAPKAPEKIEQITDSDKNKKYSMKDNKVGDEQTTKRYSKKTINKMLKEESQNISKQAKEIKKTEDYLPDFEYIDKNRKFFKKFLVPYIGFDNDMNIAQIMHDWTNFKYSPFNELRVQYMRQIGERVAIIDDLGQIFDHNFFTYVNSNNYRFDSLNFEICKFIGRYDSKYKTPTKFEYNFIKSMLGKLLICMLSNIDRCFTANKIQINTHFKQAVENYIKEFTYIINDKNRISQSWEVFENCLFLSRFDSDIYVYDTAKDLKEKLIECYNSEDFLMEQFVANTLKTMIPTIAYSYFVIIKDIYLIGRLLSIYVNKQLYKNKERKEVEKDLNIIVSSLTIEYEVNYIANINIRCAPCLENGKELSKQSEMYYIHHLLAGPQYCILKQLELSIPTLSDTLV